MRRALRSVVVAAAGVAFVAAPAAAAVDADAASAESARRGAGYLASTQGSDGSVPEGSRADTVGEAIVAMVAGGGQSDAVEDALGSIADDATSFLADDAVGGPHIARVVAGLVAAGEDPRGFAGVDWVAEVQEHYEPRTNPVTGETAGSYGGNIYGDAIAMLGLLAAEVDLHDASLDRLRTNQCAGGGWSWRDACAAQPDTDTTATALSVLAAVAGPADTAVDRARDWLLDNQNASGCWGLDNNSSDDNANSCGLAISAVVGLGEDPKDEPWTQGDRDPLGTLRSLQQPSGAFHYQDGTPGAVDYATIQAVPAQAHWSYPVSPPDPEPAPGGDDGSESDDDDDREGTRRTTSTVTRHQGSDETAGSQGGDESADRRAPQVDSSPYETTTTRRATTSTGADSEERSAGTPATRRPPPGVAGATFDGDGDGVGAVATGVAVGSLGSVALAAGWYWRRRAVTAGLVPWSRG